MQMLERDLEDLKVLLVSAFHPHLRFIKMPNFDESQMSVSSCAITTFRKRKKKKDFLLRGIFIQSALCKVRLNWLLQLSESIVSSEK